MLRRRHIFRGRSASIGFVHARPTNKYILKDVAGELFISLENPLVSIDIHKESLPKIVYLIN